MNDHQDEYDALHASRVEQSLSELQQTVKDHEAVLKKLRASAADRSTPTVRPEAPLEMMRAAYDELASKIPFLPFPDSVLPALLALRKTHQTVEDSKAYLVSHGESVETARKRLQAEQSNLRDQQALSQSLRNRIQTLRDGLNDQMDMAPEDVARERIAELKKKKKNYDKNTSALLKAIRRFIDDHLASKLAAEDLGGPVVGDMMDIDTDDLAAGFSTQGRLKKAKENNDQDKRQRRIDEIWGPSQEPQVRPSEENRNEAAAAGTEMRELTQQLLNSLVEADGDNSAAYVHLHKETAAARFLVRSKVAQFHPKDSTRLRLIDFGKDLDE
ncbi:hypothetical protein SUNI508_08411 [Seiridium unicorne]|uniref:Uncharacterized protein n=1 Tax=Seiridium unicorne TaxID=138068 RepID=A0ABR2UUD5_9PEZI